MLVNIEHQHQDCLNNWNIWTKRNEFATIMEERVPTRLDADVWERVVRLIVYFLFQSGAWDSLQACIYVQRFSTHFIDRVTNKNHYYLWDDHLCAFTSTKDFLTRLIRTICAFICNQCPSLYQWYCLLLLLQKFQFCFISNLKLSEAQEDILLFSSWTFSQNVLICLLQWQAGLGEGGYLALIDFESFRFFRFSWFYKIFKVDF